VDPQHDALVGQNDIWATWEGLDVNRERPTKDVESVMNEELGFGAFTPDP
jgi:hypothetical protein